MALITASARGAGGQLCIDHGLSASRHKRFGLLAGDRSRQASGADQLLFGPGGLPDQQAEGVGTATGAALLFRRPELFQVGGDVSGSQLEGV